MEPRGFAPVAARLKRLGLTGCVLEPAEGEALRLRAHLPSAELPRSRIAGLSTVLAEDAHRLGLRPPAVEIHQVETCAGGAGWAAREIGPRLRLQPAGSVAPRDGRVTIELLPFAAFGNGVHPTTRACLELLQERPLDGLRLADVGCGTGVLGLAALRLGAAHVLALDTDPVAVEAAGANRAHAGLTPEEMPVERGGPERLAPPLDGVLCNAFLPVVTETVARLEGTGARWALLSGLREEPAERVRAHLAGVGWAVRRARAEEGWHTLEASPEDPA